MSLVDDRAGAVSRTDAPAARAAGGYADLPIVKPHRWTWEIPVYFFAGGLTGMAPVVASAALLVGDDPALARDAMWLAPTGSLVCAALLIKDLGRPLRFLNMLRVFKWRSPMSVGTWILTAFGVVSAGGLLFAILGADGDASGWVRGLRTALVVTSGALGGLLATYTGVLLAVTVIPAWASRRAVLPAHFGLLGLGSAAASLELMGHGHGALSAIGYAAAIGELGIAGYLEASGKGAVDRALRDGRSGALLRGAALLAGVGSIGLRLLGWRSAAALVFLVGALTSRFGWWEAGAASGRDPEATLAVQRDRPGR